MRIRRAAERVIKFYLQIKSNVIVSGISVNVIQALLVMGQTVDLTVIQMVSLIKNCLVTILLVLPTIVQLYQTQVKKILMKMELVIGKSILLIIFKSII